MLEIAGGIIIAVVVLVIIGTWARHQYAKMTFKKAYDAFDFIANRPIDRKDDH